MCTEHKWQLVPQHRAPESLTWSGPAPCRRRRRPGPAPPWRASPRRGPRHAGSRRSPTRAPARRRRPGSRRREGGTGLTEHPGRRTCLPIALWSLQYVDFRAVFTSLRVLYSSSLTHQRGDGAMHYQGPAGNWKSRLRRPALANAKLEAGGGSCSVHMSAKPH